MIDLFPIGLAFLFGGLANLLKLPPLIGFIMAGFVLAPHWGEQSANLKHFADFGVTILLFSIGLKLRYKSLLRSEVYIPAIGNFLTFFFVSLGAILLFMGTDNLVSSSVIAFSLTFSSTILIVKLLEKRGDEKSVYGRSSIGILVIQDLIAVLFLVISSNKIPSFYAPILLIGLIPIKNILHILFARIERGELLVLFGIVVALGGSYLCELVNVKGDLGALIFGMLLAPHIRATELYEGLLSFKNFFLLGFFLSIGLYGSPTLEQSLIAAGLCLLLPIKGILFYFFFNQRGLRARTSFSSSMALQNYSEFGLIVMTFAVSINWLPSHWISIFALLITFSFIYSSVLAGFNDSLYARLKESLKKYQKNRPTKKSEMINIADTNILVLGMGRVGQGAYLELIKDKTLTPTGFDFCPINSKTLAKNGFKIHLGDVTKNDFWDRINITKTKVHTVLVAMPNIEQNEKTIKILRKEGFEGTISSLAQYSYEEDLLTKAGATNAFNLYSEAGIGLAESVCKNNFKSSTKG